LSSYLRLGYWPQIKEPRTFNEKIMHRKLYTNNNSFATLEDKFKVREFVEERTNNEILPELYHITDDPETIPFNELPDKYVIKPNHLSGGNNIIVDESTEINEKKIKQECENWLKKTYGRVNGEYWYHEIDPKIIIEEYIESEQYYAPIDYKFMVFHGEVKFVHTTHSRFGESKTKRNFYDRNWDPIDVKLHFKRGEGVSKPENLNDMIEVAEKLGEGFDHIRVDLYSPNETDIYFGEMTIAESSGWNPFVPRKFDYKFGEYW
jgi:hypothetical protein